MLAVAGGKGGVGKTTTTLCLAEALARIEGRAVAVDADREMPDLARAAGLEDGTREAPRGDVAAIAEGRSPGEAGRPLPSNPRVTVVSTRRCSAATLRRALSAMLEADAPVLVDCPAGAGRDAALPLRCAERALVVSTPTPASLRDAAKTVAMAEALGTPVVGAAVTRCDGVPETASRLLTCPIRARIPPATSPRSNRGVRAAYAGLAERFISLNTNQNSYTYTD
ncbi:MinD/ParA family ATP-binding protein [Halomarina pelagica]|uniref:MinD/ParA family ATP-binding protein n=1 Tax=Halomarina pelagica TaxID=2961599 RepID=UPI0020C4002A|nr:P-loop NTPase [Halomarina sp. BND7]